MTAYKLGVGDKLGTFKTQRENNKVKVTQIHLERKKRKGKAKQRMKALGWWLMLVGSLRLASVWFGFFNIWALRLAVFSKTTMTEVHGRTFGVWTLLTCTLCFLCAFNLENKPLYLATFLSFIFAFGHFLTEYLVYQTMAIANLTTVGIFAGTSIIWMLLQWNAHQPIHPKHS
ncbi:ergosterol biosynthetic protein 28-like [Corylus avellana]|uniref:ergosterol biosynthetic protein 28-like n=2 Tax=Corylus avellana TaxID=13451 RepID=UPI00286B653D|nr:ergosterol biosynthetic protein 28-like [Corylus avellana]